MIEFTSYLSFIGGFLGFFGTYIVAIPDLDQRHRLRFYQKCSRLNELYEERLEAREYGFGSYYTLVDNTLCYTCLDRLYQKGDLQTETTEIPARVELHTDWVRIYYSDGSKTEIDSYGLARSELIEIIDLALRRRCRTMGLEIAAVGIVVLFFSAIL